MTRTLILMRHAQAVDAANRDVDRPLSPRGREEAGQAKNWLAAKHLVPEHAIVSPAMRTRQTFDLLGTGLDPQYDDALYHAGADTILEAISTVPADAGTLLVVGHAPGIPALVHELVDVARSDAAAWEKVDRYFPTATAAVIELDADDWDLEPGTGRLVAAFRAI